MDSFFGLLRDPHCAVCECEDGRFAFLGDEFSVLHPFFFFSFVDFFFFFFQVSMTTPLSLMMVRMNLPKRPTLPLIRPPLTQPPLKPPPRISSPHQNVRADG